jgi:hypothetical protein
VEVIVITISIKASNADELARHLILDGWKVSKRTEPGKAIEWSKEERRKAVAVNEPKVAREVIYESDNA